MVQELEMRAKLPQLLVPQRFQRGLLHLAHTVPWTGHLRREKILLRVAQWFFWSDIHQEVWDYCASCPECQKSSLKGIPRAHLVSLLVIGTLFKRIGLDLVGPL